MRSERKLTWALLGAVLVGGGGMAVLAYLLYAFPYNGLYGSDAYAYAGQSSALLRELTGQPAPADTLFGADGLPHWPIGYHAHLMLGRLASSGSFEGGRLITLALAAGVPVLAYLLVVRLGGFLTLPARLSAGLVAAGAILVTATFTRMGTSLMSDVPAMFWALLACVLTVWGWPPAGQPLPRGSRALWAAGAGACLGMAVFVRYASVLQALALIVYLVLRYTTVRGATRRSLPDLRPLVTTSLIAVAAFLVVLVPQALYLQTHEAGAESGTYFASMTVGNVLSRSSTGPDGPAAFPRTMLEFYVLSPLWDAPGGFLPVAFLPLALLGVLVLAIKRQWAAAGLLLTWWLVPAVAYATTPYQTHRYALLYLPAISVLVGPGAAAGVEGFVMAFRRRSGTRLLASTLVVSVVVALLAYGSVHGWRSVRSWQATHAAWQAGDEALARDVQKAAGARGRVVCFTVCAPIDLYTGLPVRELYHTDETALAGYVQPGETVAVVPEENLAKQWAGQPVARRWDWLQARYSLEAVGKSGEYSLYRVNSR